MAPLFFCRTTFKQNNLYGTVLKYNLFTIQLLIGIHLLQAIMFFKTPF